MLNARLLCRFVLQLNPFPELKARRKPRRKHAVTMCTGANKKQMLSNTEDHQLGIPCHLADNTLYAIREAEKRGTLLVF